MGKDEQDAVNLLTDHMRNEMQDDNIRVSAATGLLLWSALESIAKHFDPNRG